MKRSHTQAVGVLIGLLLALLVLSVRHYQSAYDSARRAAEQAGQVRALSRDIAAIADRPAVAASESEDAQQLSGLIETAAAECGIDSAGIARINAQAPRQVGQSPYARLPTRVNLENVELDQLFALLYELTDGTRFRIDDCRLTAPHGEVVGDTWDAEFSISYLMYDARLDTTAP